MTNRRRTLVDLSRFRALIRTQLARAVPLQESAISRADCSWKIIECNCFNGSRFYEANVEEGIELLRLPTGRSAAIGSAPYDARVLFGLVPEVEPLLSNFADASARLLPHILIPGIPTHQIDTFLVSLMGGSPELIQSPHATTCSSCSRTMQFLFQIGDFLELDGDAPVVYVYGCSQHTTEVKAHVDMY